MRAAAVVEFTGVPIDVDTLNKLRAHWDDIKEQLIADVDKDYGVFDGTTFKTTLFEEFLIRHGIPWPRLASGRLALDRDTFKEMGRAYPIISPLRELKLEAEGLACKVDGKWQLTETGQRVAREEMAEDFGIWAPLVRLLDRVKAGGCCLTDRSNAKFSNVINGSILP